MGPSFEIRALAVAGALAVTTAMFAATLVWLVHLPADAFRARPDDGIPALGGSPRRIVRSIAGLALILLGAIMALPGVPGPGIALVLLGFLVADLPGKRRAEMHLLRRPQILNAVNALRRRFDRGPLLPPG